MQIIIPCYEERMSSTGDINAVINRVDILESCRVCMKKNMKMSSIFNDAKKIINKIEFCTGIWLKEDVGLPTQICKSCLRNLSVAYKFKTTCILSEQALQRLQDVNFEIVEDTIDVKKIKMEALTTIEPEIEYEEISNCDSDNEEMKSGLLDAAVVQNKSPEIHRPNKNNRKIRGPYKKTGPRRLKKLKYSKLACEPCGLKFSNKQLSDDHKLQHKEESWICEICGKSLTHRSSLHAHVASHTRVFSCAHCDYHTGNKFDLIKHMHIHLGVKRFKCSQCPSVYRTSSSVSEHVRRTHLQLRPHACHLCDRTFYDRTKLKRHVDSHFDLKRFECDICHACFSRRWYWKKHLEKQHNIVVPPKRPGRQKTSPVIS